MTTTKTKFKGTITFENGLIVKHRKSAIIFETGTQDDHLHFKFRFSKDEFKSFIDYLEKASKESWANINPKNADNHGADYAEYYDRALDNNGYLTLLDDSLLIERPSRESNKLYQFNKRKMESFLYDLSRNNIVNREDGVNE